MKIRYFGNKDDGYSVESYDSRVGFTHCHVRLSEGGWTATHSGRAGTREAEGTLSCPTVTVEGTFPTRKAAAEAGLNAYVEEHR